MSQSLQLLESISLGEILAPAEFIGADDIRVRGCSSDSRNCRPGDLFVAIRGTSSDGHDFAEQAIANGAAAVIVERPLSLSVPTCVVANARDAFGRICQALARYPSVDLRVIGVTGTNGKTTTTHLIAGVLAAAGVRVGTLGTLGYCDSIQTSGTNLTTPDAAILSRWMARMHISGCSACVMEVSSHAIDQRRIAGIEFAHVCLTNLHRDHLDYHGTLAEYHRTKLKLFDYLSPQGLAVINADDRASLEHAPLLPGGVLTVGIHTGANVSGQLVERFKSEQTFLLTAGQETIPVRTAMIGDHHMYNCLMAAAVGLAEGIDLPTIVRGLESVAHVPGRFERIECGQPFGAFVDFAHTPDALTVALETVREVTAGRVICVFGAGGNRDANKRPLMGRVVEAGADVSIVTTDNPRFEEPKTIAAEILSGFRDSTHARWIPERTEAIHYALSLAGPDDCVLVAGRGHEQFQVVGQRRIPLDDRDVVRRWLYNLEPMSQYGALVSVGNS